MKAYGVYYKEHSADVDHLVCIPAESKEAAYLKVLEEYNPYAAYVNSYTTNDGKYHEFRHTQYGNPV